MEDPITKGRNFIKEEREESEEFEKHEDQKKKLRTRDFTRIL